MHLKCEFCFKVLNVVTHSKQRFCNLTCSNKFLAIVAKTKADERKIKEYEENTPQCQHCLGPIPYHPKGEHKRKKFCGSACAASYNNRITPKRAGRSVENIERKIEICQTIKEIQISVEQNILSENVVGKFQSGLQCEQCENILVNKTHSKQRFCNLLCSNTYLAKIASQKAEKRRQEYYNNNKRPCAHCSEPIPYDSKGEFKKKKFCSRSCSASYTGKFFPKRRMLLKNVLRKLRAKRVISSKTPIEVAQKILAKRAHDNAELFQQGQLKGRQLIRNALVHLNGYQCSQCSYSEWEGEPIPLHVDHINGNAGDNMPTNLRLLCPNCHAQTPTHKARNKGQGRGSRGLSLG